jgi:hypothetical protein
MLTTKIFMSTYSAFLILTVLSFISCAPSKLRHIPAPTLSEIQAANYGGYPSNYEKIIKDYLFDNLVDPDSIKQEFPR